MNIKKRDYLNICDESISPDKEIIAWERWIKIRKEETKNLGVKTGRSPIDLTMNILETVRENKERKTVLEHAQIEEKPKLRNALWEQPQKLKQKCYYEPVYEIQRTKAELGCPSTIEHIGAPRYIKEKEKGITGTPKRKPCTHLDSDYIQYREKREKDLKLNILNIDPHKPEIDDLIVVGSKPITIPKLDISVPEVLMSPEIPSESEFESVYAVQINKTIFFKNTSKEILEHIIKIQNEPWHEACKTWYYYFNAPAARAERAKLFLNNLGTVTLKYCWKRIKVSVPFIPDDVFDQVFFFNKNEDLIYPGQTKEIYFTFLSDKPGIYNEGWELSFSNTVFFYTLENKLVIILCGDSTEKDHEFKQNSLRIETYIHKKMLNMITRSLLEEIISNATSETHQIYPYKHLFLESELFQMKNPVCFYHQTEVERMKDLYLEMAPKKSWDLSIISWRSVMMQLEFDDRMKYYELLRKSHKDILRPWYEGEDLLNLKYRSVLLILEQLADKFEEEYSRLQELGNKSQVSNMEVDKNILSSQTTKLRSLSLDPTTMGWIRNTFYIQVYEHVVTSIELCAGILSSLDLNRWIHFDFCKK